MTTATSRRAPASDKVAEQRRKLATERLAIERKLNTDNDRIATIDAQLKQLAGDAQQSFTEIIPNLGEVKVAPPHAAEFKGDVPVVQSEIWLGMKPAERKQLEKSGLIKIEPQWGRASSGRVTVKLF